MIPLQVTKVHIRSVVEATTIDPEAKRPRPVFNANDIGGVFICRRRFLFSFCPPLR